MEPTNLHRRIIEKLQSVINMTSSEKTTITRLVCRQQWELLLELLRRGDSVLPIDDTVGHPITRELLVHLVCRFRAPTCVVRLMAETYPESLKSSDALGRFPIHIACAWGASTETIEFLICQDSVAASIQDNEGKAPIHHLCQSFQLNYQDTSRMSTGEAMLSIINMLKAVAPNTFNLEDNEEANAIEYAIESDTNIKIIRAIQRACRDTWREMKRESFAPHEELQLGLKRLQVDLRTHHLSKRGVVITKHNAESTGVPITGELKVKVQTARTA